jgi:hypothetical protein
VEEKITRLYTNHENEIRALSMENLSYFHNYFKHEYMFQKHFVNQSSLECIKDRKKISLIYKSLNSEIKKRYS